MAPADMAPGNRYGRPYRGFINLPRCCGSLLLQPRIISRRRRDGRRRGTGRHHRSKAAKSDSSGDGSICVKSFHVIPPDADAADVRIAADASFALDHRDFKATKRDRRF
jgi:hypothetical protein